ncbi:MAG TPA: MFS transporter [Bryobacteraceae bacterium]|jgi:ACS family hexuronate transporter-like MFS transporter
MKPPIRGLRWYIGGILFLSTVINYIDRQTLSVLGPNIKHEFGWNNQTFALLIIAFRIAYAFGQTGCGRFLDAVGVRRGLTLTVAFYSVSAMLTSLAFGLRSLCAFRFLLGAGESANWPGATKTVSEWFPRSESGWAVALFDSGSAIGGAIAPVLAYSIYHLTGGWRAAFLVTGTLGLLWIPLFRAFYRKPENHPRLSPEERNLILAGRAPEPARGETGRLPYAKLLRMPQTWGVILSKMLTDPVWFMITDWLAILLVARGYSPEDSLLAFWIPFLSADLGNFAGGGLSSYLIRRGWTVDRSRKFVCIAGALGMTLLAVPVFVNGFFVLVAALSVSTLCYAAFSTIILTLPADLYPTESVASVSGMSGTGAGIGTIAATYLTGYVADHYSFGPVLVAASIVPLFGAVAVLALVRVRERTK